MKWLIFGGTGQVGRSLAALLENFPDEVRAPTRTDIDLSNSKELHKLITGFEPDVVVNAAAWTDVPGAESLGNLQAVEKINSNFPAVLARLLNDSDAKLIHLSTDYVFGGSHDIPWQENDITQPLNSYGRSKLNGERAIQEVGRENSLILRTGWVYSPYGTNFVKKMIRKLIKSNEQLSVVNDQLGQPTSATEIARAIIDAVNEDLEGGLYHYSSSGKTTWYGLACEIASHLGLDSSRINPILTRELNDPVTRPEFSVLSHNKWIDHGMRTPTDWRETLELEFPLILLMTEED